MLYVTNQLDIATFRIVRRKNDDLVDKLTDFVFHVLPVRVVLGQRVADEFVEDGPVFGLRGVRIEPLKLRSSGELTLERVTCH